MVIRRLVTSSLSTSGHMETIQRPTMRCPHSTKWKCSESMSLQNWDQVFFILLGDSSLAVRFQWTKRNGVGEAQMYVSRSILELGSKIMRISFCVEVVVASDHRRVVEHGHGRIYRCQCSGQLKVMLSSLLDRCQRLPNRSIRKLCPKVRNCHQPPTVLAPRTRYQNQQHISLPQLSKQLLSGTIASITSNRWCMVGPWPRISSWVVLEHNHHVHLICTSSKPRPYSKKTIGEKMHPSIWIERFNCHMTAWYTRRVTMVQKPTFRGCGQKRNDRDRLKIMRNTHQPDSWYRVLAVTSSPGQGS